LSGYHTATKEPAPGFQRVTNDDGVSFAHLKSRPVQMTAETNIDSSMIAATTQPPTQA